MKHSAILEVLHVLVLKGHPCLGSVMSLPHYRELLMAWSSEAAIRCALLPHLMAGDCSSVESRKSCVRRTHSILASPVKLAGRLNSVGCAALATNVAAATCSKHAAWAICHGRYF